MTIFRNSEDKIVRQTINIKVTNKTLPLDLPSRRTPDSKIGIWLIPYPRIIQLGHFTGGQNTVVNTDVVYDAIKIAVNPIQPAI
jgi:hypothetical protein